MGILWIILIGVVAGVVARLLAPGPPAFRIPADDGAGDRRRVRRHLHRAGCRLVSPGSGRGVHRGDTGRDHRAVHLELDRRIASDALKQAGDRFM
jgi:hypothetical protein